MLAKRPAAQQGGVFIPVRPSFAPHKLCRQAIVKPKFRQALVDLIKEAGVAGGCPKSQGALLYTTASKVGARQCRSQGVAAVDALLHSRESSQPSCAGALPRRLVSHLLATCSPVVPASAPC